MQQFDDYKKQLAEKRVGVRVALLECMAQNCDSLSEIAKKVGVCWMTMNRFLVKERSIDMQTLAKICAYLDEEKEIKID